MTLTWLYWGSVFAADCHWYCFHPGIRKSIPAVDYAGTSHRCTLDLPALCVRIPVAGGLCEGAGIGCPGLLDPVHRDIPTWIAVGAESRRCHIDDFWLGIVRSVPWARAEPRLVALLPYVRDWR